MDYGKWITTSAGTDEDSAKVTEFKMCAGIIHRVYLLLPLGQAATHRVKIFHGNRQLWPSYRGEYYAGDNSEINFKEYYELKRAQNILRVFTWNTDEVNDHTVFVSFSVLAVEELDAQAHFFARFEEFLHALGV